MTKKDTSSQKQMPSPWHRRYTLFCMFLFIYIVFLGTLLHFYPNLPVIERLAENIPGYDKIYPPFRVDEYNYTVIAKNILEGAIYKEGSLEKGYTIGFPLVAAPFIAVFGDIGGYVANGLIIWVSLVVFYLLVRRYSSQGKAFVLTFLVAFTTLNWFYAVSCYTEPLSQLFVLLGFFLLTANSNSPRLKISLFAAGIITALNLFVRPHYILLVIPFFLYLWIDSGNKFKFNSRTFLFAGGVGIVVGFWLLRNILVFGNPFTFEYSRLVGGFIPGGQTSYMRGNIFLGTHQLLFDQYHGLFTITPILLLFPVGLRSMWCIGMKKESLILLMSVVIMVLFAAASPYPFTEFGLGSRHMVPIIPLMVFPCVFFLNGTLFSRSVITILALYSFYHAGIGWFTGGEPGMGFFLGILNESQSRAVILARKGLLPEKQFNSQEELIRSYLKALKKADLYKLLQTMDPIVIQKIRGNERQFMIFLRNQRDPSSFILSTDVKRGIIIRSFSTASVIPNSILTSPDSSCYKK